MTINYTEITKPTIPALKWDDPMNFFDEEDLSWDADENLYGDLDIPFMGNWFIDTYFPFLDTGYPFQMGSFIEITKPI